MIPSDFAREKPDTRANTLKKTVNFTQPEKRSTQPALDFGPAERQAANHQNQ
jgi:hypothetical protein